METLASGNFTVSFWAVRDGDMVKFSSAVNTGFKATHAPTGDWSNKTQFDVGTGGNIRWVSAGGTVGGNTLNENEWYHIVGTFDSNNEGILYQNGEQVGTDATYDAGFKGLVVGVNRSNDTTSRHWKGYVDELKVFGRTFTQQEVAEDCMKSDNCTYVPVKPKGLNSVSHAEALWITWTNYAGVDNYTLSYNTSAAFNSGATVADGENAITISGDNTGFWLTGIPRGHYVNWKIRANNRNGSSGWSNTLINQPTLDFQAQLLDPIASGGICKIKADRTGVRCIEEII